MRLSKIPRCSALVRLDAKLTHWDHEGRIYIPPAYRKQAVLGTVVLVGDPLLTDDGEYDLGLEVGDRVYLGPYNGKLIDMGDEHEYRLCRGYNPDPHLQQARHEIPSPETAWPDIYCKLEHEDGTPFEGRPRAGEIRAWINRVLGRGALELEPEERVSVPDD